MAPEIVAFSANQVSKLTGLSLRQLGYWDDTGFFSPEYASGYGRNSFSRVYSFRDLVGLYTIARLRKRHKFSLQELRRVAKYLHEFHDAPWSGLAFYIAGSEVFFRDPLNPDQLIGARPLGQTPMDILEMEHLAHEVVVKTARLRNRGRRQVGRVERNRFVVHNMPVLAGTRVPTRAVWNLHEAGYNVGAIIREFPRLKHKDIDAAIAFERTRRKQRAG